MPYGTTPTVSQEEHVRRRIFFFYQLENIPGIFSVLFQSMAFVPWLSLCDARLTLIPIHHCKILFQFLKSRRQGKLMSGSRRGPAMDGEKKYPRFNISLDPDGKYGFFMF